MIIGQNEKPTLALIYNNKFRNVDTRLQMLSDAAAKLNLNPWLIDAEAFDFSELNQIDSNPRNLFYNVTPFSHEIENAFIAKGWTSFFIKPTPLNHLYSTHQLSLPLFEAGVSIPKTIIKGTNNRALLEKYVDYLNGFPLILKVNGGTLGLGVIKIESWESLISICDFLVSEQFSFELKQFIENDGTVRLQVIGGEIVACNKRFNIKGDFRCSSPGISSEIVKYDCSKEMEGIAKKVCQVVNYDFLGIDIIEDSKGVPYVLETNFPNDFTLSAEYTGVDVAYEALKYLVNKSLK